MRKGKKMNNNNHLDKYFMQAQKSSNPQSFFSEEEIKKITQKGYHPKGIKPLTKVFKIVKRRKIMSITLLSLIGSFLLFTLIPMQKNNNELGKTNYKNRDININYNKKEIFKTANDSENTLKYKIIKKFVFIEDMKKNNRYKIQKTKTKQSFEVKKDDKSTMTINFYPDDKWLPNLDMVKEDSVKIGTIKLDVEDLLKIRHNLKKSIMKYNPPSQDILTFENDSAKFENLLGKSIDKAVGDQTTIAKIQLYGYICRLFAYDIRGIEEIKLNDKELEKLNVFKDSIGYYALRDVEYDMDNTNRKESLFRIKNSHEMLEVHGPGKKTMAKYGWDTTIKEGYYRNKIRMYRIMYGEIILHYNGWDVKDFFKVQAVAISKNSVYESINNKNRRHNTWLSVFEYSPILKNPDTLFFKFQYDKNQFESQIHKMIPIKIGYYNPFAEDSSIIIKSEYTLWYILNEDLINALPIRYQNTLRKELDLMTSIDNGSIHANDACEHLQEEQSYLDLCRLESNSIKNLLLYPNPTTKRYINLKFNLAVDCKVRIDIHEISGRFITNLSNSFLHKGKQTLELYLNNKISQGIYLISISNNKGELVVRKLMVE